MALKSLLLVSTMMGSLVTGCVSGTVSGTTGQGPTPPKEKTEAPNLSLSTPSGDDSEALYTSSTCPTPKAEQITSELDGDATLIRDHSCEVELLRLGTVDFVAMKKGRSLELRLRDINGIYTPLYVSNLWRFWEMDAVAFQDINGDGVGPDIAVIAHYVTGIGPTGGEPFPSPMVMLNDGNDNFDIVPAIQDRLMDSGVSTIAEIRTFLSAEIATTDSVKHCFRNEYGGGENRDVEELLVTILGNQATGEYHWIPAFKDRRFGTFEGTVTDNIVDATYTYTQEDSLESEPISVLIEKEQATFRLGGVNDKTPLERVDCWQ